MGSVTETTAPLTPPRADLERIWPYVAGRHRDEIAREYGIADVLKLASNENALGASPRAIEALAAALDDAHLYPDSQAVKLRTALAGRHGVAVDQVVVGSGSVECIDLVARAFLRPGDHAVVGAPSFPRFQIACQVVGVETTTVRHDAGWRFDLDGVLDAIEPRTRVVFVDNPCNPTGTHIQASELAAFLDRVPPEVTVVLDRAYYEFVAPERRFAEGVSRISEGRNLVVLRTFSKAYGLAGLRIGYAVARPETARAMNRVREAFNTTVYGQVAATAALADEDHIRRSVAMVDEVRPRLRDALEERGFAVVDSHTNFVFTDLGPRAAEINEGLLERGIIIRPMVAPGLESWARITVPLAADVERFVDALDAVSH